MTLEVTSKTCQNDFKLHTYGWFGLIFENIKSDLPKEVRGQSWPWKSLQKQVKMTSNCTFVNGLGLELRIFYLTHQKRSEAKVDHGGQFKNKSKWLQIVPMLYFDGSDWIFSIVIPNHPLVCNFKSFKVNFSI